jgi:hypothetical protein
VRVPSTFEHLYLKISAKTSLFFVPFGDSSVGPNGRTSWSVLASEIVYPAQSNGVVQGWINLDGPGSNDLHFATGTFSNVGNMHRGRAEHESTLLSDGTVLITGGTSTVGPEDLYKAATRSFSEVGQLGQERVRHTATLLSHPAWGSAVGKVIVIGGSIAGNDIFGGLAQATSSTELFDTATGQFSQFATMTVARENHTATLLLDGRILVTGGVARPFVSGTAELLSRD